MTTKIAASLVVSRDSGADGLCIVELDGEANDDITTFAPGDTVNFLVHHDATVQIGWVRTTDGTISGTSSASMTAQDRTDQLLFADVTDTHELSYVPTGSPTPSWYGNEATGFKKTLTRTVEISGLGDPALCDATYSVSFRKFSLSSPNVTLETDSDGNEIPYPVVIVVHVENI